MAGILTDPQQRADVIAYLSTLEELTPSARAATRSRSTASRQ